MREIFNNLVDNALKYTPAGGKIKLDLETDPFLMGLLHDIGILVMEFLQQIENAYSSDIIVEYKPRAIFLVRVWDWRSLNSLFQKCREELS